MRNSPARTLAGTRQTSAANIKTRARYGSTDSFKSMGSYMKSQCLVKFYYGDRITGAEGPGAGGRNHSLTPKLLTPHTTPEHLFTQI